MTGKWQGKAKSISKAAVYLDHDNITIDPSYSEDMSKTYCKIYTLKGGLQDQWFVHHLFNVFLDYLI